MKNHPYIIRLLVHRVNRLSKWYLMFLVEVELILATSYSVW